MTELLTWREERSDDESFLLALFADSRARELEGLAWEAEQRDAFVLMQFRSKESQYRALFPHASYRIIVCNGRRIGRMVVSQRDKSTSLVDIALFGGYRNNGYGTNLITALLESAQLDGHRVCLHVAKSNSALRLYQRLGFQIIADHNLSWLMEWADPATLDVPPAST